MDNINITYSGTEFPLTLKKLRLALGYNQERFAKQLNVKGMKISTSTLRAYEQGARMPLSVITFLQELRKMMEDEFKENGVNLKINID